VVVEVGLMQEDLFKLLQLQDPQSVLQVDPVVVEVIKGLVVQLAHVLKVMPVEQDILIQQDTQVVAVVEPVLQVDVVLLLKVEQVEQVHLHLPLIVQ